MEIRHIIALKLASDFNSQICIKLYWKLKCLLNNVRFQAGGLESSTNYDLHNLAVKFILIVFNETLPSSRQFRIIILVRSWDCALFYPVLGYIILTHINLKWFHNQEIPSIFRFNKLGYLIKYSAQQDIQTLVYHQSFVKIYKIKLLII